MGHRWENSWAWHENQLFASSVGNAQPAKYSSDQTERTEKKGLHRVPNDTPYLLMHSFGLNNNIRTSTEKKKDKSVGWNTSESSKVAASYCMKRGEQSTT